MYNHNDIKSIMNNEYSVIRFTNDMSDEFNRWFISLGGDDLGEIYGQLVDLYEKFQTDIEYNSIQTFLSPNFDTELGDELRNKFWECQSEFESFYYKHQKELTKNIFRTFGFDGEFENKSIPHLKEVSSV